MGKKCETCIRELVTTLKVLRDIVEETKKPSPDWDLLRAFVGEAKVHANKMRDEGCIGPVIHDVILSNIDEAVRGTFLKDKELVQSKALVARGYIEGYGIGSIAVKCQEERE